MTAHPPSAWCTRKRKRTADKTLATTACFLTSSPKVRSEGIIAIHEQDLHGTECGEDVRVVTRVAAKRPLLVVPALQHVGYDVVAWQRIGCPEQVERSQRPVDGIDAQVCRQVVGERRRVRGERRDIADMERREQRRCHGEPHLPRVGQCRASPDATAIRAAAGSSRWWVKRCIHRLPWAGERGACCSFSYSLQPARTGRACCCCCCHFCAPLPFSTLVPTPPSPGVGCCSRLCGAGNQSTYVGQARAQGMQPRRLARKQASSSCSIVVELSICTYGTVQHRIYIQHMAVYLAWPPWRKSGGHQSRGGRQRTACSMSSDRSHFLGIRWAEGALLEWHVFLCVAVAHTGHVLCR